MNGINTLGLTPVSLSILVTCIITTAVLIIYTVRMYSETKNRERAGFIKLNQLKNELSLLKDNSEMTNLLDSLPFSVEILKSDGTSYYRNLKFRQLMQLDEAQQESPRTSKLILDSLKKSFKQNHPLDETVCCDYPLRDNESSTSCQKKKWYRVIVRPIFLKQIDENGFMVSLSDVTTETELHNKLSELRHSASNSSSQQSVIDEAMKISNQRTSMVLDSADIEYWEADTSSHTLIMHDGNNAIKRTETWKDIIECIHPNDLTPQFTQIIQRANEKKDIMGSFELRCRTDSGKPWNNYKTTIVTLQKSELGEVTRYGIIVQNITEDVNLHTLLKDTNIQLELSLRTGCILPITVDIETRLLRVNILGSLSKEILGFDLQSMKIDDIFKKLSHEDRQKTRLCYDRLAKGELMQYHEEISIFNGTNHIFIDVKISGTNYERDGRPRTLVGVVQNITTQHQLLNKFKDAKIAAEKANDFKSAFLANMSHKIRTPLNAIVGFSELVAEADSKDEREEYSSVIHNNNELLLHLVDGILNLSKIETGSMQLQRTQFDMAQLFGDLTSSLSVKHCNSQVLFMRESIYENCIVNLDPQRVSQVISNFVTNAMKYTTEGKVLAGYKHDGKNLIIYVKDSGIGLSAEKQKGIFNQFHSPNGSVQEIGLGLPLVKQLVENAGGKVGVDSEEGKGSCFYAKIPCFAEITPKPEDAPLVEVLKKSSNSDGAEIIDTNRTKILIVKNDSDGVPTMEDALKGYTTMVVNDEKKTTEAVAQRSFDIILLDLKMPDTDGATATRIIRKLDKITPIIAVTPHSTEKNEIDAIAAGCDGFVSKPVDKNVLIKTIERFAPKCVNVL